MTSLSKVFYLKRGWIFLTCLTPLDWANLPLKKRMGVPPIVSAPVKPQPLFLEWLLQSLLPERIPWPCL